MGAASAAVASAHSNAYASAAENATSLWHAGINAAAAASKAVKEVEASQLAADNKVMKGRIAKAGPTTDNNS